MRRRPRWLRVEASGPTESGAHVVWVRRPDDMGGEHVVLARAEDLADAPGSTPAPADCRHAWTPWRARTAEDLLRDLYERIEANEGTFGALRAGREYLQGRTRYERECESCHVRELARLTLCRHAPWDREHLPGQPACEAEA